LPFEKNSKNTPSLLQAQQQDGVFVLD